MNIAVSLTISKFKDNMAETWGVSFLPLAILAQGFKKGGWWIALGLALLPLMLVLSMVTILAGLVFSALLLVFYPFQLILSAIQDAILPELYDPDKGGFLTERTSMGHHDGSADIITSMFRLAPRSENELVAEYQRAYAFNPESRTNLKLQDNLLEIWGLALLPLAILSQSYKRGLNLMGGTGWWLTLGIVLTFPMVIVSLVTIPTGLLFTVAQLVFYPFQLAISYIQKAIIPTYGINEYKNIPLNSRDKFESRYNKSIENSIVTCEFTGFSFFGTPRKSYQRDEIYSPKPLNYF